MWDMDLDDRRSMEIAEIANRYFWWSPTREDGRPLARQIAQIMHFGTYDDIRRLESLVGREVLAEVLLNSEPGWFDDRSWEFWRGRLASASDRPIPLQRARRAFADDAHV